MHSKKIQRHPKPRLLACALAGCLALAAPVVMAQSTSAILRGVVSAEGGPAAAARVTAVNTQTGLSRSVQADANGNYVLAGLPPGSYRVTVEAGGSSSTRNVVLAVGQAATLNLGVAVTTLETVTVTAEALQETRTSEVASYVSTQKIEALPQNSRNFLSFADTVPGVLFEQNPNDDTTKLRSGGQNSNGINVFIDGVGQKNYVLTGGISGQDSTRGNPFPQLAIGEYKVITSNYKAEYDQLSSAAVTAATRSGTNDLKGSVFWDRTSELWRDPKPSEEAAGFESESATEQYGMSIGGPIVKDRLFYFVTYEGKDIISPRDISAAQMPPGFALPADLFALTGPTSSPFSEDLWFGKLTWQPDGDNLVELSVKQRKEEEITGIGGVNTAEYGTSKTNDSLRGDLRWQFNAANWLNDVHLTFEDEEWSPHAINTGIGFKFTGTPSDARAAILNVGAGEDFQEKGQKGWAIQEDFTWFGFEGHTIKAGVKYKDVEIRAFEQAPLSPQYLINLPSNLAAGNDSFAEYVPYEVQFGALIPGAPTRNITTDAKQFGIYIQDDWQVTDRLMLNLGLRWDYEKNEGWENWVTPQGIADALRAWPNLHAANTDYNIEDYISTGNNRDADKDNLAPRIGFSYDLNADERHVIFGGAGRSYDRNLWNYLQLEQSKHTFPRYHFQFNVDGFPCDPATQMTCVGDWDPSYYNPANLAALVAANPNLGAEVNMINNDLETPYSDQFSLGMRNAFTLAGWDWTVSTTLVRIESHDGIVFTLGNRWPDGSFRDPSKPTATWGNQPWGFGIPGFGTLIIADNGIETRTNQFLLGLDKLYTTDSPWSLTLAYTYSDASENRMHAAERDEHYMLDHPNLDNEPFYRSAGVPKHRLVVSGYGDLFWDMQLSGKLTLASPSSRESTNCFDATSGDNCFFQEFEPDATFGYKQFDLALRKNFDTGTDLKLFIRVDAFNLFNWHSWTDYDNWRGFVGDPNPTFGAVNGLGIAQPPRTFKLSMGFDF